MKISLNLVILCLIVLLNDCKEKERETISIDEVTNSYCDFKIGSWWIYKEENSGKIDTLRIVDYKKGIESSPEFAEVDFEYTLMHTSYTSNYTDTPPLKKTLIKISADYYIPFNKKTFVIEKSNFSDQYVYYSLDSVGEKCPNTNVITEFESFRDSVQIVSKYYYEVRIYTFGKEPVDFAVSKRIYWAKNIGKIRFETYGGEVWNLVDYHVIK